MAEIKYSGRYLTMSRSELLTELQKKISQARLDHSLRVETQAIELAKLHGVNVEKASIAALLHDYAKEYPPKEMLEYASRYWPKDDLELAGEAIWHGLAAAYLVQEKFVCHDREILQAIARHTMGWYEMTLLDQVIYIADYIEPGRDFPGVQRARELAQEQLLSATHYKMTETLRHVLKQHNYIYPPTIDIYNAWLGHHLIERKENH